MRGDIHSSLLAFILKWETEWVGENKAGGGSGFLALAPSVTPAVPTCCQSSAIRPQAILPFTDIPCAANSARLFLDRFLLVTVMWPVKADIDAVYIEGANFPQNCIFLTVVKPLKQQLL